MSIGPRSLKKRPRNDLDDYLDEVDSRLFCVTRADRQCLHRDLKAHVRELTTDERSADRFGGRYQITMKQLREEIGEPDDIVAMYISSVKRKVPSLGLRMFLGAIAFIFMAMIIVGIDRYRVGITVDEDLSKWLITSGLGLALGGIIAFSVVIITGFRFERNHRIITFLALFAGLMSVPLSTYLARQLTKTLNENVSFLLNDWYGLIILVDVIIVIMIGLFIYLKHFQVMSSEVEVA